MGFRQTSTWISHGSIINLQCYVHFCCILSRLSYFVVVRPLSPVRLFATPWTEAPRASLSFTVTWSSLKFMSIWSVTLFTHLILSCCSFPNVEPVRCSMSSSVTSWPAYRFSQEIGKVVWYSHLFKNFPQLLWSTES